VRELSRFTKLSAKPRDQALEIWRQGNQAFQQRREQEAEANYDKLIKLARAPSLLSNFAAILLATNRAEAALQRCQESYALDPEHLETWLNRGGALLALERLREALACFDQAVALQPNMLEPWMNRGNALIRLGQLQPSVECYDTALRLNPNRPECWNNRGVALSKLGALQEAVTSFERALKIQADYFPASLNRVLVIDKLGRFDQAKHDYRVFLKQAPPTLNGQLDFVRSRLRQLENGVAARADLNLLEPELAK
jgi:superkiller protein 3